MARAVGRKPGSPFRLGSALALLALLALPGCQPGVFGGAGGTSEEAGAAGGGTAVRAAGRRTVERDVERPDIFELQETGLWDGRPSLGGIWVAHPDAADPERVVIRHTDTGASVAGALFRREREQPGPRFQVSSEAANALGILPGAPTTIRVTALRLEAVEVAPQTPPAGAAPAVETEPPRGLRALFQWRTPAAEAVAPPEAALATDPAPLAQTPPPRRRP